MYRFNPTRDNPIREFKFLREYNPSKLTFLELCYSVGFITCDEWINKFRPLALKGKLK